MEGKKFTKRQWGVIAAIILICGALGYGVGYLIGTFL